MKICVISSSVFAVPLTNYGGLEAVAYYCAKGLAELGHEVALVAPEGSTCSNVSIIATGPPRGFSEKDSYARYWHLLPQFDCIISHDWEKWCFRLKQEGKLKAPILSIFHAPVNTQISSLPPVEKPCVVCISQDQADHVKGLFSYQAEVCYNGIDLDFYKPMNLPRNDRFLFLARFSSIKGADLAIEACLQAGVGLDLVGDTSITNEPDYFHHCMKLAERSSPNWDKKNGKQIRVVGSASRGECVAWFSRATALLHPVQRFREVFGLAPVEAMACGCPCISWDNGAMRETVIHNKTGYLVRSMQELVTAIGAMRHADSFGNFRVPDEIRKDCRENASRFSIQKMCLRYEELAKKAVNEGGW